MREVGVTHQVKGDVLNMSLYPAVGFDLTASDSFYDKLVLGELEEGGSEIVAQVARAVAPPCAETMRDVRGNCQTWVHQVATELVEKNVILPNILRHLRNIMDPPATLYMQM